MPPSWLLRFWPVGTIEAVVHGDGRAASGQRAGVKVLDRFPERQHLDAKVEKQLHPASKHVRRHERPGSERCSSARETPW